jgi:hypothetical protein
MIVDVGLGEATGIAAVQEILRSRFVPHVFITGDAVRRHAGGPDAVLIQKPYRDRIWSERFKGRSQQLRPVSASRSEVKRKR